MMFPPPPPPEESAGNPALDLARHVDCIFLTLLYHLARAFHPLGRFAIPAYNRISRANQRILSILRRIADGTFPPPRTPRTTTCPTQPESTPENPRRGGPPAPYLPRRRGWLGHIAGSEARAVASQLRTLFARPETQATIAAAPAHARVALERALRATARLLNVELPAILQPPPKPPAPPRPPRAPRAPRPRLPPLFPPLQPYVLAAARAWKPKYG